MLTMAALWFLVAAPQEPVTKPPTTGYDPLAVVKREHPTSLALTVHDADRNRDIPVRIHLPAATEPAPVVLWSHGLGGSRDNNGYLHEHWADRGYVVVALQHSGSDAAVWQEARLGQRRQAMQRAASAENLKLRCEDVHAVLDALASWQADPQHECHGRFDLEHVGMAGHSFGAFTTQCVGGQAAPLIGARFRDPRIDAALPMSPSAPRAGSAAAAFGGVTIPWLLMTGTADDSPIGDQTPARRREVFPALPTSIDRAELVLDGAQHSAFSERGLPGDRGRNPNHHRVILALSTAFWDSTLRGSTPAHDWLYGAGPRTVLEPQDQWLAKRAEPAARQGH